VTADPVAVFTEKSCNRKLSPVDFIDVGKRFQQPHPRAPFCSSTFASIQASCPDSCRFKKHDGKAGGCFADAGFTAMRSARYDRAAAGMTPLEVIREEVAAIDGAFGGGSVPQDGARGGRDLRLHVGGDAANEQCASELGAAAGRWRARGGGDCWSYTHAWPTVRRAAWGPAVAVLASIEHESQVELARAQGYAPAVVVAKFPRAHRRFELGGVSFIPCLAEVRKTTCVECRLCFRGDLFDRKLGIAFQLHGQHDAVGLAQLRRNAAAIADADWKRRISAPRGIVG
jgi:hypothetical protein